MEENKQKAPKENTNQKAFNKYDWKFKTFNDPTLEEMLHHAKKFVNDVRNKIYYPLTYSGPTEVGKTHILERCATLLNRMSIEYRWKHNIHTVPDVLYESWKTIVRNLFDRENGSKYMYKIRNCGVLIMTEFLSQDFVKPNDYNVVVLDFAHEVLDEREKKPILIDTNKSLGEIEHIDKRIASRLNRYGGVVLNINPETPNYLSRCS